MSGERDNTHLALCGFPELSLIWLLAGRGVPGGICDCPGTISTDSIGSPNVVGAGEADSSSVCRLMNAATLNSVMPYVLSLSRRKLALSLHPSWVNSSSFICFCRNLSMCCWSILDIVPTTLRGSSSSLSLLSSVTVSSQSSPSSSWSELARWLILFPIAIIISSNIFLASLVVNPTFPAFLISSCSCLIAASASPNLCLATAVSLSTWSSIHISFSSLLRKCVSLLSFTASIFLDRTLRNAPRARTIYTSRLLLPSFAWWYCRVEHFIDSLYLPARCGETFFFGALTIVVCVDYVVWRDVGCCMIWTIWGQATSFMSRLVRLINLNKSKSMLWSSLKLE